MPAVVRIGSDEPSSNATDRNQPSCIRELEILRTRPQRLLISTKILQELHRPVMRDHWRTRWGGRVRSRFLLCRAHFAVLVGLIRAFRLLPERNPCKS